MFTIRNSREDRMFDWVNHIILIIALIIVAYPLYFVIIASISNPTDVSLGRVWLFPQKITWEGYKRILGHTDLWIGYKNTILYTVIGTGINIILTLTGGYALSRKDLPGRNMFMAFLAFTMFFNGGLIPTYLLVRNVGLYNTFWAMVIPNAVGVWNIIITRTFFQSNIPDELLEAAVIDGCNDARFFVSIVLPLSKAIIAVLTIFYAVGHWNSFFNGLIYLKDRAKFPLQIFLREILIQNEFREDMEIMDESAVAAQMIAMSMKYGIIIVSSLPVLVLYPFLQRYFVKGVTVGAIKG